MDVLSPELVWIENRCYRVNPTAEAQIIREGKDERVGGYIEPDFDSEEEPEAMEEVDYEIERTAENSFRIAFHVPSVFHGAIIGQKGATRRRLEMETRSLIKVPNKGTKDPIIVTAQREADVVAARKKIGDIALACRKRQEMTHFFSFPCCTEEVKEAFRKFKEAVLAGAPADTFPDVLFQIPEKLHVTLSYMVLMDNEEREMVKNILHREETAIREILAGFQGNTSVKICGLDSMNDDPEATRVLFAKIQSEALQNIADHLHRIVRKSEFFIGKDKSSVKLHMTLMNVSFDKDDDGKFKRGVTFNAKKILQDFGDYTFGEIPLTEIHLSQRKSYDEQGYYKATTKLIL
uniref:Putative transcription coactivator complex n=1 Tax=Lutzomyia longipalpis TaxID=7200 RepID=A0A7G3AZQ2_LUTLO